MASRSGGRSTARTATTSACSNPLLRYFRIRDRNPGGPLDYHSDRSHYTGLDAAAFQRVMNEEHAVLIQCTITKAYGNI
jgi:hypothetical protein